MKEFWDDKYSTDEFIYGNNPNDFLKEELSKLDTGAILLPCEGEGRNAIYCASNKWEVTCYDFSDVAVQKAIKLAESMHLKIDYKISEWQSFNVNKSFDVIGVVFAHFQPIERFDFHRRVMNYLKKDGIFIAEYFHKNQINHNSGGPKNINMLYDLDELQHDFSDYEIIKLNKITRELSEGSHHQGIAETVQLVVRKGN